MELNSEEKKIDYKEPKYLVNYLNIDLDEYKSSLYILKSKHENEISIIKYKLKKTNVMISEKCKKINGSHDWISEREDGMYGEIFSHCKHCRVDRYNNEYLH